MSSIKGFNVAPQDVFSSYATQGTDLGAFATTNDGRIFRYAKAGVAPLVPGTVVQAPAQVTGNQNLAVVAASAGAKTVVISDSTTVVAGALTGGYLATTTGTGYGYSYKISGNSASTASSLTVYLEDAVVVGLSATDSKVDLTASPFNGVIISPTTASSSPLGVAVSAIPAGYFGWVQSHGSSIVTASGALTVGLGVCTSVGTAGNVVLATSAITTPVIGTALTAVSANESGLVFLSLE